MISAEYPAGGDDMISWSGEDGYFAHLKWSDEKISLDLNPTSEAEWAKAYAMIGYCAYHGIEWVAP